MSENCKRRGFHDAFVPLVRLSDHVLFDGVFMRRTKIATVPGKKVLVKDVFW